jgi:hypothetical protein
MITAEDVARCANLIIDNKDAQIAEFEAARGAN